MTFLAFKKHFAHSSSVQTDNTFKKGDAELLCSAALEVLKTSQSQVVDIVFPRDIFSDEQEDQLRRARKAKKEEMKRPLLLFLTGGFDKDCPLSLLRQAPNIVQVIGTMTQQNRITSFKDMPHIL